MKILIGSPAFPPSLGGLERFVEQLATGLAERGDEVTVMTSTPSPTPDSYPFRVVRCPGPLAKLRLVRECEVFFQANVSLKDLWPLALIRRPWVISHHGQYAQRGVSGVLGRLKVRLARHATRSISVSRFVASRVDPDSAVIGNPYDDALFRILGDVERDRDLIFVGRLVSDKGADVLVRAVARLAENGCYPTVTLVGAGPEDASLRSLVEELGLCESVQFRGRLAGEALVRELNRHRVLVAPSICEEGFGIVALEGIACGCVVVGTARGGLIEAIGSCGAVVPNGDAEALTETLGELLRETDLSRFRVSAAEHLERHRGAVVIDRYWEILLGALRRGAE